MNESPIRNSSGDIGCPKCFISLQKKNAPFKMYGEHVGNFESYVCPICNYSALTENGYDAAMIQAKQLAINQDIPEIKQIPFKINYFKLASNDQTTEQIHENEQEIQSSNYLAGILELLDGMDRLYEDNLQVNLLTKKTRI